MFKEDLDAWARKQQKPEPGWYVGCCFLVLFGFLVLVVALWVMTRG